MGQSIENIARSDEASKQQLDGEPASTVGWDDLTTSLIGRRLASNAGTVDYDWEENCIAFSPGGDITNVNDCVNFNLQKPHGASVSNPLMMHFHWEQVDSLPREITVRYRIQDNNATKTTTWTEVIVNTNVNNVFSYTSGTFNQITTIDSVDWSTVSLSSTVQFRMTRSDAISGAINVTFVDGHVAYDQERGSIEEFEKVPT